MRNIIAVCGFDREKVQHTARKIPEERDMAVTMRYSIHPPKPTEVKKWLAVIIVVGKDDMDSQAKWQLWLKAHIYSRGVSVNWSVY